MNVVPHQNVDHEAEIFPEVVTQELIDAWTQIDLKLFLSLLSLAEPAITQTKVAKDLKISPVTLSRIVNSDNRKIKAEWVSIFTQYLDELDVSGIQKDVETLGHINSNLRRQIYTKQAIPAISQYLSKQGFEYQYDESFWGLADGILRFSINQNHQWLFSTSVVHDTNKWRFRKDGIGPFSNLWRMKSITQSDRISVVYRDSAAFGRSVKYVRRDLDYPCYHSLILLDDRCSEVVEEYVLFE